MMFDDPYDSSLVLADGPAGERPLVQVEGLARHFPDTEKPVFRDAWFSLRRGETVCLVGHSGCGKSTMLRLLAGLDTASDGAVLVDRRAIMGPSADRALVSQEHGLKPWLTILDNIAFAVRARWPGWTPAKVYAQSQHHAALLRLTGLEGKKPGQVSATVKLRVCLARAVAAEPRLLLLDEPFAALDPRARGVLLDEVRRHCVEASQTVVMATHDIDEALFLADRILLMTNGPDARIAETVRNTLPRARTRKNLHGHAPYYALRDHLIAFLIERSRQAPPQAAPIAPPPDRVAPTPISSGRHDTGFAAR